ncbi:hypothetical protein CN606_17675 [Bacillus toyonensis]|nr:hypothetical protein CN606_17675 [Bacillus toyonensis]
MVGYTAKLGNGNKIDVIKREFFYYIYHFTEKTLVIAVCRINKYMYIKLDKIRLLKIFLFKLNWDIKNKTLLNHFGC